jgi:DNA-binding NarL/FixJ family response regulator
VNGHDQDLTPANVRVLLATSTKPAGAEVTAALTGNGFSIVGVAVDPEHALDLARSAMPDVALVSLEPTNEAAQLRLCRSLRAEVPACRLLVMACDPSPDTARQVVQTGARGVFDLELGLAMLGRAIDAVGRGEVWISRSLVAPLLRDLQLEVGVPATTVEDPLTAREHAVLQLLAQGCDNQAIADRLFVSPHTVRTHIRNVMRKLGAHSRLEAVVIASGRGLLPQPGRELAG